MNSLAWKCVNIGIVLIGLTLIYTGIINILFNYEENQCKMTWMYETPQYIPLPMNENIKKEFPNYALYIYGEGSYAGYLKAMGENLQLTGVPALFVHGNAGRYKQVRSLASISLRKSETLPYHFNYFSVDYDEELSGLYGPFLQRQTKFLWLAMKRVFRCYKHLNKKLQPSSIILIGHSMGGLSIRGLYSLPEFNPRTVRIIVTFATPYVEPPLKIDALMEKFYQKMNRAWENMSDSVKSNITFLSLGGGYRDYLVNSALCRINETSPSEKPFFHRYQITSSLPTIWRSTDHQCIVWCNELIRKTTKAFFEVIHPNSKQISKDPIFRANMFNRLFFHNNSLDFRNEKSFVNCKTVKISRQVFEYTSNSILPACIRLDLSQSVYEPIILYVKSNQLQWLYQCNQEVVNCTSLDKILIDSFSSYVIIRPVPSYTYIIQLLQHNILYIQPLPQPVKNLLSLLSNGGQKNVTMKKKIRVYNLLNLNEPWNSINFNFRQFSETSNVVKIVIFVPWSHEIFVKELTDKQKIEFRLLSYKPYSYNESVKLLIITENLKAKLNLKMSFDLKNSFGQLLRFNVNKILSLSLILCIIIPLSPLIDCAYAIGKRYVLLYVIFIACKVIFDVLFSNATILSAINRFVTADIFIFITSYSISAVIRFTASTIVFLIQMTCYPIMKFLFHLPWLNYIILTLFLSWYVKPMYIHCILIMQVIFHIASSYWISNEPYRHINKQYLISVLPTVLLTTAIPIIIDVKGILDNKENINPNFIWEDPTLILENPTFMMQYIVSLIYLYYLYIKFPSMQFHSMFINFLLTLVYLLVCFEFIVSYNLLYVFVFMLIFI